MKKSKAAMNIMIRRRKISAFLIATSLVFFLFGTLLGVNQVHALLQKVTETGKAGFLTLRADPHPMHWQNVQPGDEMYWQIEAALSDAANGALALEIRSDGALVTASQMLISVTSCTAPFAVTPLGYECDENTQQILTQTTLDQVSAPEEGTIYRLADLRAEKPRYLLVKLKVPQLVNPNEMVAKNMRIGVGLHASGDDQATPKPPYELAQTGSNNLSKIDVLVVLFLALGVIFMAVGVSERRRGTTNV